MKKFIQKSVLNFVRSFLSCKFKSRVHPYIQSIISTIHERTFRVINGIHKIIAIVEDSRSDKLGSLKCAKEIWELALIPVLLNSAETWSVCDSRLFKTLDDFQCKLWRGLLQVPKSCPLPALTYDSNSMLMKYKV